MKTVFALLFLITFLSCTQQTTPSETKTPDQDNNGIAEATPLADEDSVSEYHGDSTFYIGFVEYFPDTKEYYTQLYFRKDNPDVNAGNKLLDSTIVSDMDFSRERLPMAEAEKMLVMENMDKLFIYNKNHELITTGSLIRVESLFEAISSQFIAVYKPDKVVADKNEPLYGITAGSAGYEIPNFSVQEVKDQKLTEAILKKLDIDTSGLVIEHYKILPYNSIYSCLSTNQVSYITELKGDSLTILSFVNDDTIISGIFPLPIQVNNRPALLISGGVRESDYLWDYLAVFKDSSYVPAERDRLRILSGSK